MRFSSRSRSASGKLVVRSEEHTSELQSQSNLVCRLLLEKKKTDFHSHSCHNPILAANMTRAKSPQQSPRRKENHTDARAQVPRIRPRRLDQPAPAPATRT